MLRNFTLVYTYNYLYRKFQYKIRLPLQKKVNYCTTHFIQFCKIQIEVETIDIPIITFRFYQII